ncbi:MAG: hypothetical protein JXO22_07910 [Phycisphaerae bacterium]|nr:hypothetical protein [Phycisphaerae bacterium]
MTCYRGDTNNDGSVDVFDIDSFVAGMSGSAYYPGLDGCVLYHGDTNCDDAADVFDIDSFVLRIMDEAAWQAQFGCDICPAMLLGAAASAGGTGSSFTPSNVAALLSEYTSPSWMASLIEIIESVATEHPSAAKRAFWESVLGELE